MTAIKKKRDEDFDRAVATLDEEEARSINPKAPMKNEEGVVRDVPLIAGFTDKDGNFHSTFSYREMNGRDEEAITKADVRVNPAKVANVIAERCVISIGSLNKRDYTPQEWGKIIKSMWGNDIDYMVFKIRELSKGHEVTFKHKCPECGQTMTTVIDTEEFEIIPFSGETELPFTLERGYKDLNGEIHYDGFIRPATGEDREAILPAVRRNPSTASTMLMTRCMRFNDGTQVIQNRVADMVLRDRKIIEDILSQLKFGVNTDIQDLECPNCGANISGTLGESDFF